MQHLLNTLRKLAPDRVLENAPMSRYTTFRVGGLADVLFLPASVEELQQALAAAKAQGIPVCLIGNGSNLIVRDGGIRGLVIVLGEPFSEVRVEGMQVWAQAGARLSAVAAAAQRAGLAGLEFASGIPGTLGGGCAMNAGAYGGELKDVLLWADVLLDGELRRLSRDEMEIGYRSTMPLRRGAIVVSACFELRRDDPEAIQERMRDLANRRREKQMAYNKEHGIVPKTIVKSVRDLLEISADVTETPTKANGVRMTERERKELIEQLETKMRKAAQMLEYEIAAQLRDEIIRLRGETGPGGKK